MANVPFALQLYSVRDHLEADPKETLAAVKAAGFDYVETAGYAGLDVAGFHAATIEAEVEVISMHVGYELMVADLDQVIAEAKLFGVQYVVVPWLGEEMCPDDAAWLTAIAQMDGFGKRFKEAGIQLCYHNHDQEFGLIEGKTILSHIYDRTDPAHLAAELDMGWVSMGGGDPLALTEHYAGRFPLMHLKDYLPGEKKVITELKKGCMDWPTLVYAGHEAGVKWFIVEQDEWEKDSLISMRNNAAYMRSLAL